MRGNKVYPCDLHGHTNRSDGADTPKEFIDRAAMRGVKIAAITDHDIVPPEFVAVDGCQVELAEYGRLRGVQVIPGIEISCETFVDDVHLVCLGCDWKDPYFQELEQFTVRSKVGGYRELVKRLGDRGMLIDWQELLEANGGIPEERIQKKMIFEMMARKGYVKSWSEAKLLVKGDPELSVKRAKPDTAETIRAVHRIGGLVILAHPYLIEEPVSYGGREMSRAEFIELLIDAGLDGIEARYTYDKTSYGGTLTKEEIFRRVIEAYRGRVRIISGGSDYHADRKKGVKNPRDIGECGLTEEEFYGNPYLRKLV